MTKNKPSDASDGRFTQRKRPAKPHGRRTAAQLSSTSGPTAFEDKGLEYLHQAGHFDEISFELRSGKEATVYVVDGPKGLLAAKLYADSRVRTFTQDGMYKEGRETSDARMQKVRQNARKFGVPLEQARWIYEEFWQMEHLFLAGVRVPQPIEHAGRVVLMGYLGDEDEAAPRVSDARLEWKVAEGAFEGALEQLVLMLQAGRVHGDFSAFNLLWWEDKVWVIDFPQVAEIGKNPAWRTLLERDVQNLCTSFVKLGVRKDADKVLEDVWKRSGLPGNARG